MNVETPDLFIPPCGKYLWEWFTKLNKTASNPVDGLYNPIQPSEYLAWSQITGNIVHSIEYDILMDMDVMFCQEINKEIKARQEQEREKAEKEAELNSRGKGRR